MYVKHPKSNSRPLARTQIQRIFAAPCLRPKRRALTKLQGELIEACNSYFVLRFFQTRPPPSVVKNNLERVARRAVDLLTALEIDPDIANRPVPQSSLWGALHTAAVHLDPGSLQKSPVISLLKPPSGKDWDDFKNSVCFNATLTGTIVGIGLIAHWAALGPKAIPVRGVSPGHSTRARHRGDDAMNQLIARLAAIYTEAFDRKAGTSVSSGSGATSGPFVKFVQACCSAMRANISSEMKRADPHIDEALQPTEAAIRARHRALMKSSLRKT